VLARIGDVSARRRGLEDSFGTRDGFGAVSVEEDEPCLAQYGVRYSYRSPRVAWQLGTIEPEKIANLVLLKKSLLGCVRQHRHGLGSWKTSLTRQFGSQFER
jgi:hypothetical protein